MRKVLLFRRGCNSHTEDEEEESAAKSAGWTVLHNRTLLQKGDVVFPRYSVYPFAKEFWEDVESIGARCINSYQQFSYTTDLKNWIPDIKELTPETWSNLQDLPEGVEFVLKGGMNSRKGFWKTQMYAKDIADAREVHRALSNDGLIGQQAIYIRRFERLKSYGDSIIGMPIAREFRFFVFDREVVCGAFYWANCWDSEDPLPSADSVPQDFLKELIKRIGDKCRGYCMDVAEKENGEWCLIELNSLEQAALSANLPIEFYSGIFKKV